MAGPYTPGSSASSQGGGGTPYNSRSGTPFTQDSGYTGGRLVADIYHRESGTSNNYFIIKFKFETLKNFDKLYKNLLIYQCCVRNANSNYVIVTM